VKVEEKLRELGLELPPPPAAVANYVGAVRVGNLLFVSGHGPVKDGKHVVGKVGRDLTREEGYEAARLVALNMLATVKAALGDLDKVKRFVKVLGFVNSTEDFLEQPKVINGASDLFTALYGDAGKHARSAIGMFVLPFGIPVEIEMVVEVEA
jgi:enamine deaminase RidA (YjgF/YER057c/UK114 family)